MILDNYFANLVDKLKIKMDLIGADAFKKFLLEKGSNRIGVCVRRGIEIPENWMLAATSICKRRFRWQDIIWMVALDEEEEGEAGIVFTEKGIYHWLEEENFVEEVLYDDISSVEYIEKHVVLTLADGKTVELLCDNGNGEEKYNRYMYNFVTDIVEFIKDGKNE